MTARPGDGAGRDGGPPPAAAGPGAGDADGAGAGDGGALPPMPPSRPPGLAFWRIWLRARGNLFAALPDRLYRAWLTELRTPFFTSYMANQPDLVRRVLVDRPQDFPKSPVVARAIGDLLGRSVFVTNGAEWARQRRIIDPSFEGGRLRATYPAMLAAAEAMVARLAPLADARPVEVEFETAHAAADVIFRALFSVPITADAAREVFDAFRAYQRAAPMVSAADVIGLPAWVPRLGPRRARQRAAAARIRALLRAFVTERAAQIAAGTAPDDLATGIMTTADPETGARFDDAEMADQMAIFFLAGHETSASALAWGLYLVATHGHVQARMAAETAAVFGPGAPGFADLRRLAYTRDVFREVLRLYPPVPMMIRAATKPEEMRGKRVAPGSPIILSPWHLGRHERIWARPHAFDPDRWQTDEGQAAARGAYIPFSTGPRVCTGAGFAMMEGVLLLALAVHRFHLAPVGGRVPEPVAQLTVRARDGIWLALTPRGGGGGRAGGAAGGDPAGRAQ